MVSNEREYLQKLAASTPDDLIQAVRSADAQEERILRIYLGDASFEEISRLAASNVRGQTAPLGNVVVLHGIMGGELTLFAGSSASLLWVQILHLIEGRFDQLGLDSRGLSVHDIRASGMYLRFYGSQLASLSRQWNVRPFFYDWRRDIRFAADALLQTINSSFGTEAPVHLVAHSMGGLVARSYIQKYPDRWNKVDSKGNKARLVMLGTPNFGSFAIPRLLFGTNDVLRLVAKIDTAHNSTDLLNIAKTFVGAYQMMPVAGKLSGLEVLYKAETYSIVPIDQSLLDQAVTFQSEIAPIIDPVRMVYVAGYNRSTLADIKDPAQLQNDNGYFFSLKGDGTVPHDLGLLPGVKTFYVDEEHQNLPGNSKVQAAMTELLETGDQQSEQYLFKGLSAAFDNQRGLAPDDQALLRSQEAARQLAKEQQVASLGSVLSARGEASSNIVSPEEFQLADVLLRFAPPLSSSAGTSPVPPLASVATASTPTVIPSPPQIALASPASSSGSSAADNFAVHSSLRVHVYQGSIEELQLNSLSPKIDCMAVGHYLRVKPSGAELDLDRAISLSFSPASPVPSDGGASDDSSETLLLTEFHERGILRGELGVPFLLPDPRPSHSGNLLAIVGMGQPGHFGLPELAFLVRDLAWSLGQLGKKHLATVLIGAGKKTLSIPDALHAWLIGLNRAISSSPGRALEDVTFVVYTATPKSSGSVSPATSPSPSAPAPSAPASNTLSLFVPALSREADVMKQTPYYFDVQFVNPPAVPPPTPTFPHRIAPTRISIEFDDGSCRYSAMTEGASVAERIYHINPKRITDINARLLATDDHDERVRLGQFLLDYLFPIDLRQSLTGSAPIVLTCNNQAAQVYWELAAQPFADDSGAPGVEPFLGLTRGLTRQLKTVLAPAADSSALPGSLLRVLLVADTVKEHPLPGARQEANQLLEFFNRFNQNSASNRVEVVSLIGPSKATTLDVLLEINNYPPFDILHYAGHCVYDTEHPENSGLLFSDDDRLTASDLNRIDRTPKLVFANACESGVLPSRRDMSSPGLPAAFAEAFFQKGVANFICTAWPVGDLPARDFALEFYRCFLGDSTDKTTPCPIFEAIRNARLKIPNTSTWGAYQHYGDPSSRAFRTR